MSRVQARPISRADTAEGFTLIEVLLALAIFTLALTGIGSTQTMLTRTSEDVRTRTEAAFFLQEVAEGARVVPYAALVTGSATRNIGGGVTLRADWTVTEPVVGKLKRADVTVIRQPSLSSGDAERAVRIFLANRNPGP